MTGAEGVFAIAPEHALALPALLAAALVMAICGIITRALTQRQRGKHSAAGRAGPVPVATHAAALLLAASGAVHLAIIPAHVVEDPVRAILFALDGAAFLLVARLAYAPVRLARFAVPLIIATIAAYLVYVLTGREDVDLVGALTGVMEVGALLLVLRAPAVAGAARNPRWHAARLAGTWR